jgi:hypothetical protein
MPAAAPMVMSVLDEVESGLVVLDKDFQAQFINRAFYQMWELPKLSDGSIYNFATSSSTGAELASTSPLRALFTTTSASAKVGFA